MRTFIYTLVVTAAIAAGVAAPAQAGQMSALRGGDTRAACAAPDGLIIIVCPPGATGSRALDTGILIGPDGHI